MIIEQSRRLDGVSEYYFSTKLRQIAEMQSRGIAVINLGIGNPDLPPSDATIKALALSAQNPAHHGYQGYRGIRQLRDALASWSERLYGVTLDAEREILPLLGSKEGLTHISLAFLDPSDEALVPDPGYPAYAAATKLAGASVRHYELLEENGWMPDFRALEATDLSRVKIMWLNYPHMPTGTPARAGMFAQAIDFARRHRILLCHDNPYSLVLPSGKPMSILGSTGSKEVALELNSLSKSHNMAGWRVGWASGSADHLDAIVKVKSNIDSGTFLPVQHAAIEALKNPESWHAQRNAEYATRRHYAHQMLDSLGCRYAPDQVGMFVWARVPDRYADASVLSDGLLEQAHLFMTPGMVFGHSGKQFIRISLCASVATMQEACERVKSYMLSHASLPVEGRR